MTTPADVSTTGPVVTASSGDGSVLVGVDAPSPTPGRRAPAAAEEPRFTADDLAKAREQEKGKLYGQIETLTLGQKAMDEELARLRADREAREKKESDAVEAKAAEDKKAAEEELGVRELLEVKEREWAQQIAAVKQDAERDRILLAREREYSELTEYRARRVNEMADQIIPELQDLVTGSTQTEIEQSLAGLAERSDKIIESATNAAQAARRDMRGTGVTAPAMGPLDAQSGQQSFTPEELAAMPMNEYSKHRVSLLNLASQSKRGLLG